jgi:hypothetical protein
MIMSELEQELQNTKYQDLPGKFAEHGVEGVFQPGIKKADLIKAALAEIEKLKEPKGESDESLAKTEDNETSVTPPDKTESKGNDTQNSETGHRDEAPKDETPESPKKKQMSIEEIDRNIRTIKALLREANEKKKLVLKTKLKEFETMRG